MNDMHSIIRYAKMHMWKNWNFFHNKLISEGKIISPFYPSGTKISNSY